MAKKKSKTRHNQQKKFSEKDYLRTRMRTLPIGKCYISPIASDAGEVTVFVTRLHPADSMSVGMYLIDKYCCGVKDAICRFSLDPDEVQEILDTQDDRCGIREVPYVEAHNLIYGAMEYAESIGIPPHSDFAMCQYILAEDNDDIPLIEYEFGLNGRPSLMSFSNQEIDHYKKMMLKKLKPEEFDVVFLGRMPEPSDDDDDDDDDDEVLEEVESTVYSDESLNITACDRTQEIRDLDDVRKVGFFIMVGAIARDARAVDPCIKSLSDAVDHAIRNYRKYGDVAFGESTVLLHKAVLWILDFKNSERTTTVSVDETNATFLLCMAYHHGITQMQLCQRDFIRRAVDDAAHSEQILLDYLGRWVHIIMETVKAMIENVDDEDAISPFWVADLDKITGKWAGKSVNTHVRGFKHGFVSKDPGHYYKRKIREAIDTPFVDDEDFMGLVFVLSNTVFSGFKMVQEGERTCAMYMLYNVIMEPLWAIANRKFDTWLDDDDLYANIKAVLSNAVTVFSNMIMRGMVDNENASIVHSECLRLNSVMKAMKIDIVDLHPLIYSTEYNMANDTDE